MLQLVDISSASIANYEAVVGQDEVASLRSLAEPLHGAKIVHINATPYGGGVSELLRSTVAFERGLGLDVDWRVISGNSAFFEVTKAFHNALQGADYTLTSEARETYLLQNQYNASQLETDADLIVIHDPQPAAMLAMHGRDAARWVWRCHIDTSEPNQDVLDFLTPYIEAFDALIFTLDQFVPDALRELDVHIIPPAIDPLSPKNFELTATQCRQIKAWIGVDPDRPVMTQVSRFDPWKDPRGVIRVYRAARERVPDLQLALLGSMATDDPEAWGLLDQIHEDAAGDPDITIATNLTGVSNVEVNAFQRSSDVVLQKSIREGFGLIVSETLWKGTPMVAGDTGGIPIQMADGDGGYLVDPAADEQFVDRVVELLKNPDEARALGRRGHERVRRQFLLTRYVADELKLLGGLPRA